MKWVLERSEEGVDFFRLALLVRTAQGLSRHELGQHAAAEDDGPTGPEACRPPTTTREATSVTCIHGPSVTTFRAVIDGDRMIVTSQYAVEEEVHPPEELARWPAPAHAVLEAMPGATGSR